MKIYYNNEIREAKAVPGWPYFVTASGQIFSAHPSNGGITRPLRPGKSSGRYLYVVLFKYLNGKQIRRCVSVHRLVLEAWKPLGKPGKFEAMHLDNNIYNNHVDNLKWGTHKENQQQSHKQGRLFGGIFPRGIQHRYAKLTEAQVQEIRKLFD